MIEISIVVDICCLMSDVSLCGATLLTFAAVIAGCCFCFHIVIDVFNSTFDVVVFICAMFSYHQEIQLF